MTRTSLALIGLSFLVGALTVGAGPASAASDLLQDRVDAVISEFGGTQTASNEVSWEGGAVVLTIEDGIAPRAADGIALGAIGNCAAGAFCAYSGFGYSGNKLTFTACTSGNSVAALGTVRSIANARTSGIVRAYDGSTLVATLSPGTGRSSVPVGIDKLNCS